jgi:hypothetical protein
MSPALVLSLTKVEGLYFFFYLRPTKTHIQLMYTRLRYLYADGDVHDLFIRPYFLVHIMLRKHVIVVVHIHTKNNRT